MKRSYLLLILIFIGLFYPPCVYARLFINEVSTFDKNDWVEIYNSGEEEIDLSTYEIRDVTASGGVNKTKLSGFIQPKGFVAFDIGNKINKDGDIVGLYLTLPTEELVDSISFGEKGGICAPASVEQTIGRVVDGGETIDRFAVSTKGQSNIGANLASCPTPTIKPTATNTPTNTPIATPTPLTTKLPTNTNTPILYPSKTPSVFPTLTDIVKLTETQPTKKSVYGVSDELDENVAKEKEDNFKETKNNNSFNYLKIMPYFLISLGILFIVISVSILLIKRKHN